jgi:cytolysin-activating lysine-acyltransferase
VTNSVNEGPATPDPILNGSVNRASVDQDGTVDLASTAQNAAALSDREAGSSSSDDSGQQSKRANTARGHVQRTFGQVSLVMMATPRYRHLSIADLQSLVLDPLVRGRIAIAQPANDEGAENNTLAGVAIWASVSPEIDMVIREQITARTFPTRLKPDDWRSGDINWLLDVIAPTPRLSSAVVANFAQVANMGEIRIHPRVAETIDPELLKKMRRDSAQA